MSETSGVWLVTAYPLWLGEGYARNVMAMLDAIGDRHVEGLIEVVPISLLFSRQRHAFRRRFVSERSTRLVTVIGLPDFGLAIPRRIADAVLKASIRNVLSAFGPRLVHARGIRAGYLCAGVHPAPVLLDIRGDAVAEAGLVFRASKLRTDMRRLDWATVEQRVALHHADGYIVVSDGMERWLAPQVPAERPRWVVPCPVDVPAFTLRSSDIGGAAVLGYLGGLQAYQGPELVAEGLLRVSELCGVESRAWVVTGGAKDGVHALLAAADMPFIVESLPHEVVRSRLCEMDVGLVPRRHDPVSTVSCPTKIGEYLAAGVPVLVGEGLSEWGEVLKSVGVGGPLYDDVFVSESLSSWWSDRVGLAQRCRAAAVRFWSWDSAAKTMASAYHQLANWEQLNE